MSESGELSSLNSAEISNRLDEAEKELRKATELLSTVKQEKFRLQRKKIELIGSIKDLDISEEKALQRVRELASDIKIMTHAFWNAKHAGL